MKKHRFCFTLASLLLLFGLTHSVASYGQKGSFINVNVGVGAGELTQKITGNIITTYDNGTKEKNKIGYDLTYYIKPIGFVDLEYVLNGFVTMFEGMYDKAEYIDYREYTDRDFLVLDPEKFRDTDIYSGSFLFGPILFHGHRFQMPVLGGVSVKYFGADPINTAYVDFVYKVRAKLYITSKFGIFAGFSGSYGGTKLDKDDLGNLAPRNDGKYDLTAKRIQVEAGLTVMVGRRKK